MAQVITFAVTAVLFVSFVISFVLTPPKDLKEHLFWDNCPNRCRLLYIVSSNLGATTTLFVFICGITLVAFSFGSTLAFGMIISLVLVYVFLRITFIRAVQRMGSVWQKKIVAWSETHMRFSIIGIIGAYFGKSSAILFVIIVLTFIILALTSEIVLFQMMLTAALSTVGGPSIDPALLTFCLLAICAAYVVRGGFEAVFKTDLFQLLIVSILLVLAVGGLCTGRINNLPAPSRIDKVIFHEINFVLPIPLGWWVLAMFFFTAFAYCVAGIDQWTRSLLFARNTHKTERAFLLTGILVPLFASFAVYLGLHFRLYESLRDNFLTVRNGVWVLKSFQKVTQLPFSEVFVEFLSSWPAWVVLLVWMGITAMAVTTIDSLLLTIPQVCRQYDLLRQDEQRTSDAERLRIGLKWTESLIVRCSNSPKRAIVAATGVAAILASILTRLPYAVSGLWGWAFQFFAAAMIVATFIAKKPKLPQRIKSIFVQLLKAMIVVWFASALFNFALSIRSERTPTILIPTVTVAMGLVILGAAIYYDRRREGSKAKKGEHDV